MNSITSTYIISADEPVFKGHFPKTPILPGVLILALVKASLSRELNAELVVNRIKKQRFLAPILPEDKIELTIDFKESEPNSDTENSATATPSAKSYEVSYKAYHCQQGFISAKGSISLTTEIESN